MPRRTLARVTASALTLMAATFAGTAAAQTPGLDTPSASDYTVSPTTTYAHGQQVGFDGPGHLLPGSRTIDYGDGRIDEWANPQASGPTYRVYRKPGTYYPVVHQLVDGTWVDFALPSVTVLQDTVAPQPTLVMPAKNTVKAWSHVTVDVVEDQTYAAVSYRVYERRADGWYGYRGLDGWAQAKTKRAARSVAYDATAEWRNPTDTQFRRTLHGLRPGRLYIEVSCSDSAGNTAPRVALNVAVH